MAESSWPWSGYNSRAVNDAEYELLASSYRQDGIHGTPSDTAVVYADSTGRQVKIRAGKHANVRGHTWYSGGSEFTQSLGTNTSGSTRVDRIVLRLDRATWEVSVEVVQGTPGAGAPTLTQQTGSTGVWEIPLAQVSLAHNYTTVTAGNLTYEAFYLGAQPLVIASASQYPVSPVVGMRCWRTDIKQWRTYDGSQWCPDPGTAVTALASALLAVTGLDNGDNTIWSYSWTPPCTGTFNIYTSTPFDGTSGEQAKLRLKRDGTEIHGLIVEMPAGSFIGHKELIKTVDVVSTSAITWSVTGQRTSGGNFWNSRLQSRYLDITYRGPSGITATG